MNKLLTTLFFDEVVSLFLLLFNILGSKYSAIKFRNVFRTQTLSKLKDAALNCDNHLVKSF